MKNRIGRIRILKELYRKFGVYLYIFFAVALILLGISNHPVVEKTRMVIANASSAVVSVLYKPFQGLGYAGEYLTELWDIKGENLRLKQDNAKLLYWVNRSQQLKQENELLKKELHFVSPSSIHYWTGYVAADNGGSFSRSILVRLGKKDGIQKGFVALYNEGVLGRVVSVGAHASRILLLTDFASRVPVFVGDKRILGIVEGNNSHLLKLTSLPEGAEVKAGDYISTSGHGGVFPPGLAVGTVRSVYPEEITVVPFVTREEAPFVQIVDYGLTGLLGDMCEEDPHD